MMDPSRWERVQAVFSRVVELPRDQQGSAIAGACADDEDVGREVLELLREDAQEHRLLDAEIGLLAENTLQSDIVRSMVQQQIGPYRLLRLLGEGGMGVVYLAERIDIGGLVAIKLLRDAWISALRRERFLAEQRTLARLNHPAIAHIYDAGVLKDGTPWFVMEFADGQPITAYLRERQPTIAQALLLFCGVCEAVQHAHGLAIIHRDLKPSNIYVTTAGEVKLLDFGIAKNLDAQGEESHRTMEGLRLMSPAYAAPEQRAGGTVGVFTDIYALGVLLYEILTGALPADRGTASDKLPVKPSLAAKGSSSAPGWTLDRHQWADLDAVCLTTLEPEPERRYRSADALARDLQAHREGRPLNHQRNAILSTAGKFMRRNRAALLGVACVVLLFLGTAIGFTLRLAAAKNAAVAEAARVHHVLDFTEELFDGGDPAAGPDAKLRVLDMLDRGKLEALNLSGDPRLRGQLMTMLGIAYGKLGKIDTADQLLEQASQELRSQPGQQEDYLKSLAALGELRRQQRQLPQAEQLLRMAIAAGEQQHSGNDTLERLHTDLGSVLALRGQYPAAEAEVQTSLRLRPAVAHPDAQLAEDLTQLAEVDHYLGQYDAAKALSQQALKINIALRGENHPAVAEDLNNLAAIAHDRAQYPEAERLQRESLAIVQSWYGPDHPATAEALSALAPTLIFTGKVDEAAQSLKRALSIQMHTYGQQHASVALTYNQLGTVASTRSQDDSAADYFRAAIAIWQQLYGPHHQFVGLGYSNLASTYMHKKQYREAEEFCRKALTVYASALPGDNIYTAVAHVRLGRILLREDKLNDAEAETLAGYRYLVAKSSPSDSFLNAARKDLAQIELGLGRTTLSARYTAEAAAR